MSAPFEINSEKFLSSDIKDYYLQDYKYVFVPLYTYDPSFKNRVSHCMYRFEKMVPVSVHSDEIDVDNLQYRTRLVNGALDHERREKIKNSTSDFRYPEICNVQCLVIVTDKEHYYFGSGIDCANAKSEFHRLKLFLSAESGSTKAAIAVNAAVTSGRKAGSWYRNLSKNNKAIAGCVLVICVLAIIITIGALSEKVGTEAVEPPQETESTIFCFNTQIESVTQDLNFEETIIDTTTEIFTTELQPETEPTTITVTTNVTKVIDILTTEEYKEVIVYITPYGKKYHFSASCAGENAMERDLNNLSSSYTPCQKCAQ